MKKVLCTGTFDILHSGHLDYFKQAKQYGDYLVVVVARDSSVIKEKGMPRRSEKERLARVMTVPLVDKAILGNEGDKLKIVEQEKPDVICLGYDQKVDEQILKEALAKRGLTPEIVRMNPYAPEKYKSSLIGKAFKPAQH
jgi:FAD synthetase